MNSVCDSCRLLKKPSHQLLQTDKWSVALGNNQAYLGRAYVTLRAHKGSLNALDAEEWREFEVLVQKLENAYAKAFGAEPLNWACLMNGAFKDNPAQPHVHWHIFPRYKHTPTVAGIEFDDPLFGHHYDPKAERIVDNGVVEQIAAKLKVYFSWQS